MSDNKPVDNKPMPNESKPEPSSDVQQGGRRKTRHAKKHAKKHTKKTQKKGASDWNKKVMMIYRDMKKKNKNVKLGAAMKEASRLKKAGKL